MYIEQEKNVTLRAYSIMTKAIGFVHREKATTNAKAIPHNYFAFNEC